MPGQIRPKIPTRRASAPPAADTRRIHPQAFAGRTCDRHRAGAAALAAGPRPRRLSGALIAQGSVVVDSNVKKVQHPTGGVVGELRVQDGDRVKAGDILVRLDDTVTRANLAIVTKGLDELDARKARLEASATAPAQSNFRADLAGRAPAIPTSPPIVDSERKLFESAQQRAHRPEGAAAQRIEQLKEEIRGLTAQHDAKDKRDQADRTRERGRPRSLEAKARAAHQAHRARARRQHVSRASAHS